MKKILLFICFFFLVACSDEASVTTLEDPSPDQLLLQTEAGLSLSLAEDTYSETPAVIETFIRNDSKQSFEFGEYYYIEMNKGGKWYIVTHSDAVFLNNPQFKDFGHVLTAGSRIHQNFSIDLLGVTLVPGEYRLVKTFLSRDEPFFEISLASPFTIE